MMILISPAKKLDFETETKNVKYSLPDLTDHSKILVDELREYSIEGLTKLMNISYGLAELNRKRFWEWSLPFSPDNAKQAILAFNGDVYEGLNAKNFSDEDFEFAQNHLRIISGLYGLLRPLDLIQPYRLPMGTRLANPKGKNLYDFWGDIITQTLNHHIAQNGNKFVLNLASNEYFKAIHTDKLAVPVVTVSFKENKNGKYRVVSFYAKRARGLMSNFIIKNKITDLESLKAFDTEGYRYEEQESTDNKLIFVRG